MNHRDLQITYKGVPVGHITNMRQEMGMIEPRAWGMRDPIAIHDVTIIVEAKVSQREIEQVERSERVRSEQDKSAYQLNKIINKMRTELREATSDEAKMRWFDRYIKVAQCREDMSVELMMSLNKKDLKHIEIEQANKARHRLFEMLQVIQDEHDSPTEFVHSKMYSSLMVDMRAGAKDPRKIETMTDFVDKVSDAYDLREKEKEKTLLEKISDL